MPRVHYRTARKAWRDSFTGAEIAPGTKYYTWKHRTQYGGIVRRSIAPPRASQLTLSEYYTNLYDLQERAREFERSEGDDLEALGESLQEHAEEISAELRDIGEECEAKRENMPESLQYAPTGELLLERYELCDAAADEIEGLDFELERADEVDERLNEIAEHIGECFV